MDNKAIIISGPTASGKSALALAFAQKQDICIINADSLQIYEGLPILSSQPSEADFAQAEHQLYSALKPSHNSSVGLWLNLAKTHIQSSLERGKMPVIVGGSGMYISKLVDGISPIPDIDEDLRQGARELFEHSGALEFKRALIACGEEEERIQMLDKQRLIRAYEVIKQTGKPLAWWYERPNKKLFEADIFTHINLNPPREQLYNNCNLRFAQMFNNGAVEEVQQLLQATPLEDLLITKTLGFAEIVDFLDGHLSQEQVMEIASQKTRNYAKRQLTWFRNQLPQKLVFEDNQTALDYLHNCAS